MNRADIAAIAHTATFLLTLLGIIGSADMSSAEGAIGAGITAACGLVAQAVLLWKYIHHHKE